VSSGHSVKLSVIQVKPKSLINTLTMTITMIVTMSHSL